MSYFHLTATIQKNWIFLITGLLAKFYAKDRDLEILPLLSRTAIQNTILLISTVPNSQL